MQGGGGLPLSSNHKVPRKGSGPRGKPVRAPPLPQGVALDSWTRSYLQERHS